MNRRTLVASLVLSGLLLVSRGSAQPDEEAPDLAGTWQCAGWDLGSDPKGDPSYRITVTLERAHAKNAVYTVTWNLANGAKNTGVGLYDTRTKVFSAGYQVARTPGVGIWQLSEDKKTMDCVGTFQAARGNVAYERWTRE
jgi:hypothetical protein